MQTTRTIAKNLTGRDFLIIEDACGDPMVTDILSVEVHPATSTVVVTLPSGSVRHYGLTEYVEVADFNADPEEEFGRFGTFSKESGNVLKQVADEVIEDYYEGVYTYLGTIEELAKSVARASEMTQYEASAFVALCCNEIVKRRDLGELAGLICSAVSTHYPAQGVTDTAVVEAVWTYLSQAIEK